MPKRILSDGVLTSETINALSAEEELFFYRLLLVVDDFGRFDARPTVIRARCYPMRVDAISTDMVAAWLHALVAAELVQLYRGEDQREYLVLSKWKKHQRIRAAKSKFPAPPEDACNNSQQVAADCGESQRSAPEKREARSEKREARKQHVQSADADVRVATDPAPQRYPEGFEAWWQHYPRRLNKKKAFGLWEHWVRKQGASPTDLIAAARNYAENCRVKGKQPDYIQHPTTFLSKASEHWREWITGPPESEKPVSAAASRPPEADGYYRLSSGTPQKRIARIRGYS